MAIDDRNRVAPANLMSGATLDELKIAASDLRALSPDGVLAELVEKKIKETLSQQGVTGPGLASIVEVSNRPLRGGLVELGTVSAR